MLSIFAAQMLVSRSRSPTTPPTRRPTRYAICFKIEFFQNPSLMLLRKPTTSPSRIPTTSPSKSPTIAPTRLPTTTNCTLHFWNWKKTFRCYLSIVVTSRRRMYISMGTSWKKLTHLSGWFKNMSRTWRSFMQAKRNLPRRITWEGKYFRIFHTRTCFLVPQLTIPWWKKNFPNVHTVGEEGNMLSQTAERWFVVE